MNTKILVVDDEKDMEVLIKQKFRKQIREKEYNFIFAENGVVALEKIKENMDIDLVLCDINMPEMDGLTLLSKISEKKYLLKSVMISAYGDMVNIRTAMNRGAFDFLTKPINFEDLSITIEKTISHIELIRQTLQAVKENNILRMYVDETVINFMDSTEYQASVMQNENIEATVVFIDVCDFTRISESAPIDTVVDIINTYFDIMVKEILAQDGYVDKFIGDAIMAIFRGDYHLDRAIDAALNIRKRINDLSPLGDERKYKPMISIGLKSGEMIYGNIGSASLKRLDFTVIGDTVNTAARLESVAKENQIIISEECYNKIRESFKCKLIGEISVKNKTKPVIIYEVLE